MYTEKEVFNVEVFHKGVAIRIISRGKAENALILGSNEAELTVITVGDLNVHSYTQTIRLSDVENGNYEIHLLT